MGSSPSKLEKALGANVPDSERYFGLENFGNTCYCNSVLQALFFCAPFREHVLTYGSAGGGKPPGSGKGGSTTAPDHLLGALARLFLTIQGHKRRTGVVPPRDFVRTLREENALFRGTAQQDAHEFLNFLLNDVAERLVREGGGAEAEGANGSVAVRKQEQGQQQQQQQQQPSKGKKKRAKAEKSAVSGTEASREGSAGSSSPAPGPSSTAADPLSSPSPSPSASAAAAKSFVHALFEGTLANETKCLRCDTVTTREESFLDLSLEIEQNTSITSCMRNFSATETLSGADKFFCDTCTSLQEAQKRTLIRSLPRVLALHLKRFKYIEELQRSTKLSYRVVFPMELRVVNTTEDCVAGEREYSLFAVVVHVGYGPNHGHYVCLVKSHRHWLLFDDDTVDLIDESRIQSFFGASVDRHQSKDVGYILFYGSGEHNHS